MDFNWILSKITKEPIAFQQLAKLCKIPINKNRDFSSILFKMMNENLIAKTKNGEYFKLIFISSGKGKFKSNPKRFGFVDIKDNDDPKNAIFFSPVSRNDAIDGDIVEYKVYIDPIQKRKIGIVTKIASRNPQIIGIIKKNGQYLDFVPLNPNIGKKVHVSNKHMLIKDHIVVSKIIKMEKGYLYVKIIKDLGHKNDKFVDIDALVLSSGVSHKFSKKIIEEANKISDYISNIDISKRTDLRNLHTITIDGVDSKDFDDAISIEKNNNIYVLYVHIADVSHYVQEGSLIDKEALKRGTSIYIPGSVIPMLPERLSNNICSLNPNVDRLTITCKMKINDKGDVLSKEVFPSVINSNNRLTYDDVNSFFMNKHKFQDDVLENKLNIAKELSEILFTKNQENGYIDFEIEEPKIILNDNGKSIAIEIKKQGLSEKMIEHFMVLANEQIATIIEEKTLPFIYRTHAKPDPDKIKTLQNIINMLNIKAILKNNPNSKYFSKFVKKVKEKRFDNFIKIILLRTMKKASYTTNNVGHFGLALKSYTHFTSPIRRYPDLMVHRMLRSYIFNKKISDKEKFSEILNSIALKNSASEIIAQDLERNIVDFKKIEFYEKYVGNIRKGIIVSINKYGMFVEFDDKVNGLVKLETLKGIWNISENGLKLYSSKTNKFYFVGQQITTKILSANKFDHKIDLIIMDNHYKN